MSGYEARPAHILTKIRLRSLSASMSQVPALSSEALLSALNWRYAVKRFDPARKIAPELWSALEESLVLTPSSYGLQPWHFIVVTDAEKKAALREAAYGQSQVSDCSHFLVFAVRREFGADYVEQHLARACELLGVTRESLAGFGKMLNGAIEGARASDSLHSWQSHQVYIALGNFLTSAALLGVDTCPLEGLSKDKVDEVLGLTGSGYRVQVCCAAGYRAADDRYAQRPKLRLPKETLFTHV